MLMLLKRYYPVLLALVGVLLLIGVGYKIASDRSALNQARADLAQTQSALSASEKARADALEEQKRLATIDKKHYEEYSNAQRENANLRARIAAGGDRVYIRTKTNCACLPGAATAPGVDDAAGYAELDPADAANLIGIAADGDAAIRQLTALREWVREVGGE